MKNILVTGGCGFIGSNLAVSLVREGHCVVCFDNLSRRGSEILLNRIVEYGCTFIHGDARNPEDFSKLKGDFDVLIECSAEPSVLVGTQGDQARYMIGNNLWGSVNCFEFARVRQIPVLFLSTSRIYPYSTINSLKFQEAETRYEFADNRMGVSLKGVSTSFCLEGYRSLYGATKLASEYLLQEYSEQYGLPGLIDRCGVIAGPWQLGKVDQGVFAFWVASHYFSRPLQYIGFGGKGKQVRDLLHIEDLTRLISRQVYRIGEFRGAIFNVGGSRFSNLSLCETTALCQEIVEKKVSVRGCDEQRPADVRWYITDNGQTEAVFEWQPQKTPKEVLADIFKWLKEHESDFRSLMGV